MEESGGKKHTRTGGKYKRRSRQTGGKRGEGDTSYCPFLPLSLPSRFLLERRQGGGVREWEAECPFTATHLTETQAERVRRRFLRRKGRRMFSLCCSYNHIFICDVRDVRDIRIICALILQPAALLKMP